MTVPAAQQCTHGGCDREATDPTDAVPVCDFHLEAIRNGRDVEDNENSDSDADYAEFAGEWGDADFANPERDVYPDELLEREQWMGRAGKSGKQPVVPWGDENAPAECSRAGHTTADKCDCDARWKWDYSDHYVTGKELEMFLEDPKYRETVNGRVFIQREDDPYAFVDGDDVVCPETGTVHPAFIAVLEHLGVTYTDVSTSGSGVHAYYRGDLPIEKGQATFEIDTEPWGTNDEPPAIEIYANKHVNVATGKHVPGTPLEINEWNEDVLEHSPLSTEHDDGHFLLSPHAESTTIATGEVVRVVGPGFGTPLDECVEPILVVLELLLARLEFAMWDGAVGRFSERDRLLLHRSTAAAGFRKPDP
ncbi:hypothetical protein [Natrinema caseinilyticum]|uniref:hypothetical protein n=1 Tax=Natrinema caseinilyticum TaxID=2961570 RepID=UPI0020C3E537|nr:hypothetical protein [Natrinema caseinilyticum]